MPTSSPTRVAARLSLLTLWPWALGLLLVNTVGLFWVVLVEASHTGIHHDNTQATLLALSVVTALVLGFRGWFDGFGTEGWALLAHQPVSRTNVFVSRVCVGLGLQLAVLLLPWLAVSAFHATPGMVAAPYFPEMTGVGIVWILAGVPVYLAVVATVFHAPAHGILRVLWGLAALAAFSAVVETMWWWATLAIIVVASALLGWAAWQQLRGSRREEGKSGAALCWPERIVATILILPFAGNLLRVPADALASLHEPVRVGGQTLDPQHTLTSDGRLAMAVFKGEGRNGSWKGTIQELSGEPVKELSREPIVTLSVRLPAPRPGRAGSTPWNVRTTWSDLATLYEEVDTPPGSGIRSYLDFRRGLLVSHPSRERIGRLRASNVVELPDAEGGRGTRRGSAPTSAPWAGSWTFHGGSGPGVGTFAIAEDAPELVAGHVVRIGTGLDRWSVQDARFQVSSSTYDALFPDAAATGSPAVLLATPTGLAFQSFPPSGPVTHASASLPPASAAAGGAASGSLRESGTASFLVRGPVDTAYWSSHPEDATAGWEIVPPLPRTSASPPAPLARTLRLVGDAACTHVVPRPPGLDPPVRPRIGRSRSRCCTGCSRRCSPFGSPAGVGPVPARSSSRRRAFSSARRSASSSSSSACRGPWPKPTRKPLGPRGRGCGCRWQPIPRGGLMEPKPDVLGEVAGGSAFGSLRLRPLRA